MPKPETTKQPNNFRLDPALVERAKEFIKRQPVAPKLVTVVETALKQFLDQHESPKKPAK